MKLRNKILIPIIIILIIAVAITGLYGYNKAEDIALIIMNAAMKDTVTTVTDTMQQRIEIMDVTKKALEKKNMALAKTVAGLIQADPNMLKTENMITLAKEIEVDEIHVTDGNGFIVHGTVEEFFGFDMKSTEQTKPFMQAVTDKNFALAQEPSPRGVDNVLFQYIGVARKEQPGLVQIGLEPKAITQLMNQMDIQALVNEVHIGNTGYVYITDSSGIVAAHVNQENLGVDIKTYDWSKEIFDKEEGIIHYTYEGIEKYAYFKKINDHIVVATYPASEFLVYINQLKTKIGIILIISVLLSIIVVFVMLRQQLNKPLNKLLKAMVEGGNGNLAITLDVKTKDEIGLISISFNKMIENMRILVEQIQAISQKSKNISEAIVNSTEEVSVSSTEIAKTIQEIAAGATNQAMDAEEGLMATNNLVEKIDTISEQTQETSKTCISVKEKNDFGIQSVKELNNKFIKNTDAAMAVAKGLQELATKSQSIDHIIAAITGIAEQTNLLALNAAIEAARAGESGRGFAVVAEEVRKLAEQSANATKEIQTIIEEIRHVITNTEDTMQYAGQLVNDVNKSLEDSTVAFDEIKLSTDSLINQVKILTSNVEEMNEAKNKVILSIQNISAVTEESAASTQQVSASTEEQTAAIEEVTASIQELDTMLKSLSESVSVFKL